MTKEGMIQKVLRRYVEQLDVDADYSIKDIQEKLIAEIKKAYDMDGAEFLNNLIGDIE